MKNTWLIWVFIVGVVLTVLIGLNYQGQRENLTLPELAQEVDGQLTRNVEFEYVNATQTTNDAKNLANVNFTTKNKSTKESIAKISDQKPAEIVKAVNPTGNYVIQVASYKNKNYADKLFVDIQKSHPAFVKSIDGGDKGITYRIYVGPFGTKKEADAYLENVKTLYKGSFVVFLKQ